VRFEIGKTYKRRELHQQFGGRWQGGICPSAKYPIVFLFTGESGQQFGYQDGPQPDGTFWYTGEGQIGNMEMTRGNQAIRDAESQGRTLHLFEQIQRGWVRYISEVSCLGHHEAIAPDKNGDLRKVIIFELALNNTGPDTINSKKPFFTDSNLVGFWQRPLEDIRAIALSSVSKQATPTQRRTNVYMRSEAVRVYVRRRANGKCEGCGQSAPFFDEDGHPYLEPHHIIRVADGGPDHPRWVAALCPNCHRRVHYGKDGDSFNQKIAKKITAIEIN
jgi:5-methylcytosine-specific restriction protein A